MLPESVDFRAMESILIRFLKFFLEKSQGKNENQDINPNEIKEKKRGDAPLVGFLNAVNKLAIQCHVEEGFVTFIGVA